MNQLRDILLDDPCPDLICGICNDILDDPMQVHCSEDHMFCKRCLNNYEKPSCPSCMEPLEKTSFQLSKFVKRQISRLRVRCIYKPLGCSWEGVLEDNHSASCNYQSIPCPNTHRGCTEKIGIMEIDKHRLECSYELLACPNNSQNCKPYLRKNIHIHNSQCSAFRCHFAFEGCPFTGTLTEVNQHVDIYCGKIHERIRELELQCQKLKQQLEHRQQQGVTKLDQPQDVINSAINMSQSVDSSMDEMALFHQMFNNGFIGMNTDENNNNNSKDNNNNNNMNIQDNTTDTTTAIITSPSTTSTINNVNSMNIDPNTSNLMDLANLPTIPLLTLTPLLSSDINNNKDHIILMDRDPLSSTAAATNLYSSLSSAPKRSTNGRIIRYSKNKQLAHGALRLARQRSSSNGGLTTEAILNALHGTASKPDNDEDINMKGSDSDLQSNIIHSSNNDIINENDNNIHLINKQPEQQQQQQLHQPQDSPRNTQDRINNMFSNEQNDTKNIESPLSSPSSSSSFAFKSLDDVTKFLEELPPIVEASPFLSPQHGKKQIIKSRSNSDRTNKSKINNDSTTTNSTINAITATAPTASITTTIATTTTDNNNNYNNNNIRRQSKSSSTNNIYNMDINNNIEINHRSTPPSIPNSPMEFINNISSPTPSVSSTTTTVKPMFVLASSFLSKNNHDSPTN